MTATLPSLLNCTQWTSKWNWHFTCFAIFVRAESIRPLIKLLPRSRFDEGEMARECKKGIQNRQFRRKDSVTARLEWSKQKIAILSGRWKHVNSFVMLIWDDKRLLHGCMLTMMIETWKKCPTRTIQVSKSFIHVLRYRPSVLSILCIVNRGVTQLQRLRTSNKVVWMSLAINSLRSKIFLWKCMRNT